MAHDALPDNIAIIYGLADPITTELRYIGKTHYGLGKRRRQHIYHSKNSDVRAWVADLRSVGSLPEIFEIEKTTRDLVVDVEQFWIDYFRFVGASLLNKIAVGASVGHTEEIKARLAALASARMTASEKSKRREFALRQWSDPVERERMLSAQRECCKRPEIREMRSKLKLRDWAENPEYRKNYTAAQALVDRKSIALNFWQRPEYRERQEAARDAANVKRSASLKATWAKRKQTINGVG